MKVHFKTALALSLLLLSAPVFSASTKEEVQALREQVTEIQKELAEIKKLLQEGARAPSGAAAEAAFREQVVSIGTSPVKGDAKAPVTIIEYSDYQCPFCARNYRDVLPRIQKEYIDTGKVKFVMREFPLPSLHANAMNASMAALCAGDQAKYWDMHNIMFDNQRELSVENLKKYAGTIGLDSAAFDACLDQKKYQKAVEEDMATGAKLGMRGTPGFFLGRTDEKDPDKVNLSVSIRGAQSFEQFRATIENLLKSQ